jgi:pimeloyl-ACP methyl ester carboxylesterase
MSVQGFLLSGGVFVLSLVAALIAHVVLKHDPFAANKLLDLPDIRSDYQYVAIETYNPNVVLQTIKIGENDKEKELVVLLHGFPETALISWYHQLGAFADSNQYFVLAPDMRGYNHSSKPENIMDYSLPNLIQDVHAIIHKYANRKKAHIIAHDW